MNPPSDSYKNFADTFRYIKAFSVTFQNLTEIFRTYSEDVIVFVGLRGYSYIMSYRLGVGGWISHSMTHYDREEGSGPNMMYDNDRGGV